MACRGSAVQVRLAPSRFALVISNNLVSNPQYQRGIKTKVKFSAFTLLAKSVQRKINIK
tara:strand:- start:137 stop:313 length:177 start_codon:yes stop_codon:yes gene_type:complete